MITDTPETDAAAFEASFNVAGNIERDMVVSAVVARRLERERDEARDGWHYANGVADLAIKHRNEAEDRIRWAECILGDLATGYWNAILNDADDGKMLMGERVLDYWRHFPEEP